MKNQLMQKKKAKKTYTEAEVEFTLDRLRRSYMRLDTSPRQLFRWNIFLSNMTPNAKLVSLALLELANGNGVAAETSQTLEIVTGLSKATIKRVRIELEGHPFVGAKPSKGRAPNVYHMHIPAETISELSGALSDAWPAQPAHTEPVQASPTSSHRAGSEPNQLTQSRLTTPTSSHRAPDLSTIPDHTAGENRSELASAPRKPSSLEEKNEAEKRKQQKEPSPPVPAAGPAVGGGGPRVWRTAADLRELRKLLEAAAGECLADEAGAPRLIQLSEPLGWLAAGRELELDILPAVQAAGVRALQRRGARSVKSWAFFADAVNDAYERRMLPLPEPRSRPRPEAPYKTAREREMEEFDRMMAKI